LSTVQLFGLSPIALGEEHCRGVLAHGYSCTG
jgi:hypothetical protein